MQKKSKNTLISHTHTIYNKLILHLSHIHGPSLDGFIPEPPSLIPITHQKLVLHYIKHIYKYINYWHKIETLY